MKVLIDTCVVIDLLQKREPFVKDTKMIFTLMAMERFKGFISAKAATDIFYLSHRNRHGNDKSREILQSLLQLVSVMDTTSADIHAALFSPVNDFEDAVMIETAKRCGAECIITRNEKHFEKSAVTVYGPKAFIGMLEK